MVNTLFELSNPFNGFYDKLLLIISIVSIFSAIFTVIIKNPIVSVLFLIALFSSISLNLIFIGLNFIGLSYLLVYVGAVSILFLFILMLINIRVSELTGDTNNNIPLAGLVIFAFFLPISNILPNTESASSLYFLDEKANVKYVSSNNWEASLVEISDISGVGNVMYTSYNIWLIITSLILLLAMVGSIVITNKQRA